MKVFLLIALFAALFYIYPGLFDNVIAVLFGLGLLGGFIGIAGYVLKRGSKSGFIKANR